MGRSLARQERIPVIDPQTNIKVLKASRKKPRPGDVFAMQLPDGTHLFGRVVGAELEPPLAPMPLAYLIYVYDVRSAGKQPDLGALLPDRLLLPPVFINRMPWTKGYFENVAHQELEPDLLLQQYCFWDAARGRYVDEQQNPLPQEVQPCGDWGLSSYRWLDDQISDALGVPRVPEDA
jgi:hypothetical protein